MPELTLELPDEGNQMVDLSPERTETILSESLQAHSSQMLELGSNTESALNIARHSLVRKIDEVDSIEAAAVDRILRPGV